ncbi:MAG: hypothetical protein ACI9GH_000237 [Candidatus Paceibacteria bacterium]|jgi:hypothetical protein
MTGVTLKQIEVLFDRKFDEKFDERFYERFDLKFDQKFDEKFGLSFDERFDRKFREQTSVLMEILQDRLDPVLEMFQHYKDITIRNQEEIIALRLESERKASKHELKLSCFK